MKKDFREAVINMLFETEEEEPIVNAPLEPVDVRKPPVVKTEPKKEEINVKEMIYGDKAKKSLLIDVDEKKTVEPVITTVRNEETVYETQPNLSPIFGVIRDEKVKVVKEVVADESQVKKPRTSYLGTVLSPIFGYDTEKANEARVSYQETNKGTKEVKDEDPYKDTDITAELYDFFDEKDKDVSLINEMINDNDMAEEIDLFEDLFGDKEF